MERFVPILTAWFALPFECTDLYFAHSFLVLERITLHKRHKRLQPIETQHSCGMSHVRPCGLCIRKWDRDSVNDFQSHLDVDILAAGELPDSEPEQADKHNPGAVQPADLQSSRLPWRCQHGAQVRDKLLYCIWSMLLSHRTYVFLNLCMWTVHIYHSALTV